jgi:hypothetical protein
MQAVFCNGTYSSALARTVVLLLVSFLRQEQTNARYTFKVQIIKNRCGLSSSELPNTAVVRTVCSLNSL